MANKSWVNIEYKVSVGATQPIPNESHYASAVQLIFSHFTRLSVSAEDGG